MLACWARGPRIEPVLQTVLCYSQKPMRYTALGTGCTLTAVSELTQPCTIWETVMSISIMVDAKKYFYKLVYSLSDNPRRLWQTVSKVLNCEFASPSPSSSAATSIAFASFFTNKISKLPLSLANNSSSTSQHSPSPLVAPPDFSVFKPTSESEVSKILFNSPNKQSDYYCYYYF